MRPAPLTVIKGGINRLRTKGGARADTLYDLLNGYVTDAGTVRARPGTFREAILDSATRGLCSFGGKLHVFASSVVEVPAGYVLHVIAHPDSDGGHTLERIHFAKPFMGFLYVVAEFDNGDIYHFWLQSKGEWQASTVYRHGDIVEPTTPNGLAYRATRYGAANPSWAPNVPREVGDIVEPTEYNDFYYEVVDTIGANPSSGETEPDWPTKEGAQVAEDANGELTAPPTVTEPPDIQEPDADTQDRYTHPRSRNT